MKRFLIFILLIAVIGGGLLFAQGRGMWNWPGNSQRIAPEKITISGTLGIASGQIAITSGGTTYFLLGLDRFIGFIDGLREGASVQVEGYNGYTGPSRNQNSENDVYMRVTQLVLGGKTYDMDNGFSGMMGSGMMIPGMGMGMNFRYYDLPERPQMNQRMQQPQIPQPSQPWQRWQQQNNSRRR